MSTQNNTAFADFCRKHARAFRKLREYAADDTETAKHLAGVCNAQSMDELVANSGAVYHYAACDITIDELESELRQLSRNVVSSGTITP